jgi:tetratricopeptide (TPR) repeat protein
MPPTLTAYPEHTADLDEVNALCRLVDGLPLAIELAAPWIRTLSASDLLVEIKHSIDILSTRESAPDDRHRSMQAVLDSTWRWLSEDERRTLQALGVFVGGFSSEAAALIAQASPALLDALGERSLIQRLPDTDDGPRYGLHELVRRHALQMLEAEGPAEAVRARNLHLDYFLDLYERARADLDGPNELRWAGQVRRELANAEAARLWALTSDQTERVLRLTAALSPFWGALNGALPHRNEFLDALALPWDPASETVMAARASVLNALGFAVMSAADLPAARHHFEEASVLYQRLGDPVLYARALNNVGWDVSRGEDPQSAIGYLRQGLPICQQVGDPLGIAWSHYDLGEVLFLVGQDAEAERLVLDALRQTG